MGTAAKLTAVAVVVIGAAGAGGYFFAKHKVDERIAALKDDGIEVQYDTMGLQLNGWAALKGVKADMEGQMVSADAVAFPLTNDGSWDVVNVQAMVDGHAVKAAHIAVHAPKLAEKATSGEMSVKVEGLSLPLAMMLDGSDPELIAKHFGGDQLQGEASFTAAATPEKLTFNYGLATNLFGVDVSGDFGGVDFVEFARKVEQDPEMAEGAAMELMSMQLNGFKVAATDLGFAEKFAALSGEEGDMSADDVRGMWAMQLQAQAEQLRQAEFEQGAVWAAELDKLAQSWKGMSISLDPQEPVPLMSVMMMMQMNPSEAVNMLNATVTAM